MASRAEIETAYDDLFNQTEQFMTELCSRQEQQRIEEHEAAKLKKLKEEQVTTLCFEMLHKLGPGILSIMKGCPLH